MMRSILIISTLALSLSTAFAGTINVHALNHNIKALTAAYAREKEAFSSLDIWLDPVASKLEDYKYLMYLRMKLNNSAWTFEESELNGYVDFNTTRGRDEALNGAYLRGKVQLKTDTVKFANHAIQILNAEYCAIRYPSSTTDSLEALLVILCPKMENLEEFTTFDDVMDFVMVAAGAKLTSLTNTIANLKAKTKDVADEKELTDLNAQIEENRRQLEVLIQTKPKFYYDHQGKRVGIYTDMKPTRPVQVGKDSTLSVSYNYHGGQFHLTPTSLQVSFAFSRTKKLGFFSAKLQWIILPGLRALEKGDSGFFEKLDKHARPYITQFERWFLKS
jgi:hypothetical protein